MRLPTEPAVNIPMRPAFPIHDRRRDMMRVSFDNAKRARPQAVPFLLAALLLLPITTRGDEAIVSYGRGTSTDCGQFIAAMEAHKVMQQRDGVPRVGERALVMEYVYGLLTGLNMSRDRAHQMITDNAAVELWLRNWCAKHPTNSLVDAVGAFSAETSGTPIK